MSKKLSKNGSKKLVGTGKSIKEQLEDLNVLSSDFSEKNVDKVNEEEENIPKRKSTRDKSVLYKEDTEVWQPLFEFEKTHEISSYGNVRSLPRIITDKNGFDRMIQGKKYKIKPEDEYVKFSFDGKCKSIKIVDALGKSFYDTEAKYSYIKSFNEFNDNEKDKFHSLSNIASVEAKITIIENDTETLIKGGLIKLILYISKKYKVNITESDIVSAKRFYMDDTFGLTVKGIPNLPDDIQIIIRKGSLQSKLIALYEKYTIINSGKILDEEYLGRLFTGKEIKDGLQRIIESGNSVKYRYAMGLLKKFFIEQHINEMLDYCLVKLPNNNNSFFVKLISLRSLYRIEGEIKYSLAPETLEKVNEVRNKRKEKMEEFKKKIEESSKNDNNTIKIKDEDEDYKLYYVKDNDKNLYLTEDGGVTDIPRNAKLYRDFSEAFNDGREYFGRDMSVFHLKFR